MGRFRLFAIISVSVFQHGVIMCTTRTYAHAIRNKFNVLSLREVSVDLRPCEGGNGYIKEMMSNPSPKLNH